jgi:protease-4
MNADELIDRFRLRRKLTFWRVAAVLAAVAAIAAASTSAGIDAWKAKRDQVAKIRIEGTITEDEELLARIERVRKADNVKGVILAIDTPGGTTAGGEAIYEAVRKLAADKPVVAQVGTLAASAGYMIAAASDHIVARKTSIVGSIGVLVQFPDVTGLMDRVGVRMEEVKSAPLKAEPNPFNPTTEEERAMLRRLIMDSYDWFVSIVAERRDLPRDQVLVLADGSIYTGRQGLDRKLVDELGGESEARAWLATKGIAEDLDIVEWKAATGAAALWPQSLGEAVGRLFGIDSSGLSGLAERTVFLDGLVSVWHPSAKLAKSQ